MPETGEYRTDHDAIIALVEQIGNLRRENKEAHDTILARQDTIDKRLNSHSVDIAMLKERSLWTKLLVVGGGVVGGGVAGWLRAVLTKGG